MFLARDGKDGAELIVEEDYRSRPGDPEDDGGCGSDPNGGKAEQRGRADQEIADPEQEEKVERVGAWFAEHDPERSPG